MHREIAFVVGLALFSVGAYGADFLRYEKSIHPSVGVLHFELPEVPAKYKEEDCCEGSVKATVVISDAIGRVIQRISQDDFPLYRGRLDFLDANGDGYVDLLIYNAPESFGPLTHADVWIYAPQLRKFVKSKTLSGIGEFKKSTQRNCVLAEYKSGLQGYTTEEWCFNQQKGTWKLNSRSGGEPEDN